MKRVNKERAYILFITAVALISLFGNYVQNISVDKACIDIKEMKVLKNELKKAQNVKVLGDEMTVNTLKNKYMIVVDELHDLKEKNK